MPALTPAPGMRPGIQNWQQYQTFINLYNEIAQKVLTYENNRMGLITILNRALPAIQTRRDFQVRGGSRMTKGELLNIYAQNPEYMNPFSFFIFFNAYVRTPGYLYGNWSAWMRGLVGQLGIKAAIPGANALPLNEHHADLFIGNPPDYFSVLDGWLQRYYDLLDKDVATRLWRLAKYATCNLPPAPNATNPTARQFIEDFNDVAPRLQMNAGLMSAGLNWMNPGVWVRANYTDYHTYYLNAY